MMKNQIQKINSIIKTISSTCTENSFCETKYVPNARAEPTNSIEDCLGEEYQDSKDVMLVNDTAQQTGFMLDKEVILCKVQWVVYNIYIVTLPWVSLHFTGYI